MSTLICKIVRSNMVLEPNVLFKNNVAVKSLVQTLRSVTSESNEKQPNNITREENKGPLRFYSDKILADKMLKAQKLDKTRKDKKLKVVLTTKKKEEAKKLATNFFQKPNTDTQMLNYKLNWRMNDYLTKTSGAVSEDHNKEKITTKSNDMVGTEQPAAHAEPQSLVSASRRKFPIRSINMNSFLQAKIEHAFARGYTNYLTPARYHHMNSTAALKAKKLGPICEMLQETLMPINKEVLEKIAVPQLTNSAKPINKLFGWNHPPPVSRYALSFTPLFDRDLSERRTRKDAARRFKQESILDEELLPEPMRRWNEYYNRCAKEKTMLRCHFDVEADKPRKSLQTEKLDALLKLSYKRAADETEALDLKQTPIDVDKHSRYTHIVNINQAKCNPI